MHRRPHREEHQRENSRFRGTALSCFGRFRSSSWHPLPVAAQRISAGRCSFRPIWQRTSTWLSIAHDRCRERLRAYRPAFAPLAKHYPYQQGLPPGARCSGRAACGTRSYGVSSRTCTLPTRGIVSKNDTAPVAERLCALSAATALDISRLIGERSGGRRPSL